MSPEGAFFAQIFGVVSGVIVGFGCLIIMIERFNISRRQRSLLKLRGMKYKHIETMARIQAEKKE